MLQIADEAPASGGEGAVGVKRVETKLAKHHFSSSDTVRAVHDAINNSKYHNLFLPISSIPPVSP